MKNTDTGALPGIVLATAWHQGAQAKSVALLKLSLICLKDGSEDGRRGRISSFQK